MKFIRQLFTQNIGLKVLSLLLAFAFWRMITSENISEIGFSVPLELRNIPEGTEVVGDVVNTVNVRIRASSRVIKGLNGADIVASIDLSHPGMGERTYPLASMNIQTPVGVEVVRVVPAHVRFRLERTTQRTVPVEVRWRGSFSPSVDFSALEAVPQEVRIEGPESRVNEISRVFTDWIELGQVSPDQPHSVNLAVDDPTVRLSREKVEVHVVLSSKVGPAKRPAF